MPPSNLKVLVVATYPRPWGIGPCYHRAFGRLGYETRLHLLLGKKADRLPAKLLRRFALSAKLLSHNALPALLSEVRGFRPHLILIWKSAGLDRSALEELKAASQAVLFSVYTDSPCAEIGFPQALQNGFYDTIRQYDCIFSSTRAWGPIFYLCGARRVEYHPFACDPEIHHPVEVAAEEQQLYRSPVAYLGSYPSYHERWLELLIPFGLKIWGQGWWRVSPFSSLRRHWHRPGPEGFGMGPNMAKVCNASSIAFNLIRAQHGSAQSLKTFEIPACRGFMLSNRTDEQREFFEEDKAAVYFSSEEELIDKVKFYLGHESIRHRIACEGWRRAQENTFVHRVPHLVRVYEQLRYARATPDVNLAETH